MERCPLRPRPPICLHPCGRSLPAEPSTPLDSTVLPWEGQLRLASPKGASGSPRGPGSPVLSPALVATVLLSIGSRRSTSASTRTRTA